MIAGQPKPAPVVLVLPSAASATIPIDELPDDVEVKVVPRMMFEPYDDWKHARAYKPTPPLKRQTLADLGPKPNRRERRKNAALRRQSFRRRHA